MSNEIVNYNEQLAALAKRATEVERPQGSTIGLRAGQLTYQGSAVPGNKLDCIIIASTHANLYYEDAYDPDKLSNPVCWAYAEEEGDLAPHPESSKPQHETCKGCPQNEFGSSTKGKGKACKNSRHLVLIPASTSVDDVPTAEMAVLKLPVTSVKNYGQYVQKCATLYSRPPLGVITTISTQPDAKSQFKVTFQSGELVAGELIGPLLGKIESAMSLLERVYDAPSQEATPAAGGKKKF